MPAAFPPDSVGLVVPQVAHFSEPLALACGRSLPAYDLIYRIGGKGSWHRPCSRLNEA